MNLKVKRKSDGAPVVSNGVFANDFITRLVGTMGKSQFPDGEGILFPKCNSIHMWMTKIPIDVLFLKRSNTTQAPKEMEWEILSLHSAVKPWKLLPLACLRADDTLELPRGTIDRLRLQKGEALCIA